MRHRIVAWDLGGAHLKYAVVDARGELTAIRQLACPLWQGLDRLTDRLRVAFAALGGSTARLHAVTMTGELCDCFRDRQQGVARILETFTALAGPVPITVYGGRAGWLTPADAAPAWRAIASANWHATAACVALTDSEGVLVDVGSTTTDLVPYGSGEVRSRALTDADRLAADELVYTGVCRTPVMALCDRVPYVDGWQGLAAEYFANTADVYRLTGELPPDADLHPTADGGPRDLAASARRLARMVGRDADDESVHALERLARYLATVQFGKLQQALSAVVARASAGPDFPLLVGAGVGEFLVQRLAAFNGTPYRPFAALADAPPALAHAAAVCAPAVALARLAAQRS
ncbi:MAG: S-layer protein [Gammaproteobacteria bacterium]|nr:S-layer protein [Gammaproteobacteria bacterium]MBI5618864.1 S-layer protein [Gammaproteobacteria bacterium]